ncbi:helix-turn-helix transcriptional regulator [Actinospica durhamensis]|uniref:Helix-turn-helix transcriptional regulator n=1 Tax=Actinospica durhamensis TaxID=1508375 RepID=A0A941END7_9ACTN|nr:helix-turn-helix domain-containing protein [Actinospica durhamensis]MBR7834872.1 helix-turn-helix transcriptional regulator [Actinospica durhamensis]
MAELETDPIVRLTGALDPRGGWSASRCTIAKAIDVVGNRSAFLILREAFYGTTRFDDFAARVGVTESVAAARLKALVDEGLLVKRPYREVGERTRYDYHLTEMGADFFPVLTALMQWGERWREPAGVQLRHRDCGAPVHAELRCDQGHPVTVREIDLVPKSAAGTAQAAAADSED